ncbi:MAG TPA: hypothetical protein VNF46_05310 [Gammaproteobacteria bacterium]|nr:hypothetical protein [Gammaproteobacteria bacterium]
MSLISNFEAELKALIIKVLEDLDLYHPPIVNAAPEPSDPVNPNASPK